MDHGHSVIILCMYSEEAVKREILELHQLFEQWYQGRLPDRGLESKIGIHLAQEFCILFPDGGVHRKNDLLEMMRPDRGNDPGYRIVISNIQIHDSPVGEYHVRYVESQYWEGSEKPNLVIQASSILKEASDRLLWASIHETKIG